MVISKKKTLKEWIILITLSFVIVVGSLYYAFFFTPKDSLELYQVISFANDFEEVQHVMLNGHEKNFKEEDFEYIKSLNTSANRVSQFTLFEYEDKTFVIMTSPGRGRLKVLSVEEMPTNIRNYFLELEQ